MSKVSEKIIKSEYIQKLASSEKDLLILMSIGFAFSSLLAGLGLLLPIGIWFIKKDELEKINTQGKEFLNYSFLLMFLTLIVLVISFYTSGLVTAIIVPIYSIAISILGIQRALKGEVIPYPSKLYKPIK
ncbi:DUF4870 domain-containing protein [Halobacteriovorax sp.]|uniref:DUF4870 domain-containing protein n=1 Tax=Halobacteriovorax sp. TaxID=2020862 RepID=UPI003568DE14